MALTGSCCASAAGGEEGSKSARVGTERNGDCKGKRCGGQESGPHVSVTQCLEADMDLETARPSWVIRALDVATGVLVRRGQRDLTTEEEVGGVTLEARGRSDVGRGPEMRAAGSLQKLEKTRKPLSRRQSLREEPALPEA